MNLVFLVDSNQIGGNETVLKTLFRSLKDSQDQVHLLTQSPLIKEFLGSTAGFIHKTPRTDSEYRQLFQRIQPSHCVGNFGPIFQFASISKRMGIPVSWLCAQYPELAPDAELNFNLGSLLFDSITVPSQKLKEHLSRYTTSKLFYLPNGIDTKFFTRSLHQRQKIRQKLSLSSHEILIGYSGRFVSHKRHIDLIHALSLLGKRYQHVHLLLLGGTDHPKALAVLQNLKKTSIEYKIQNRVHFKHIPLDLVPSYLSAMDIFAFPGIHDVFPCTLLEAMSCELPVIVNQSGGLCEATGEAAYVSHIPPQSPQALATALMPLLDSPSLRTKWGQAARKRIVERFSLDRMTRAYKTHFAQLHT